ncbi:hypothetical protein GAMM_60063 [Gammaproteobacteria bacterium]
MNNIVELSPKEVSIINGGSFVDFVENLVVLGCIVYFTNKLLPKDVEIIKRDIENQIH